MMSLSGQEVVLILILLGAIGVTQSDPIFGRYRHPNPKTPRCHPRTKVVTKYASKVEKVTLPQMRPSLTAILKFNL